MFSSLQRLKFEIAEVMTEIEQLTCVGERWVSSHYSVFTVSPLWGQL